MKAKAQDEWIELIDTVFKRLKREPATASSLARQLGIHYYRVKHVLDHLVTLGSIQRLTIQVRWPTGHVTPATIYIHPRHRAQVTTLTSQPQPIPAHLTNLRCLQQSSQRQQDTINLLKTIMKNH